MFEEGQGSLLACAGFRSMNTRWSPRFPKWRWLESMAVVRGVVKVVLPLGRPWDSAGAETQGRGGGFEPP